MSWKRIAANVRPWRDELARYAYFIYLSEGCPRGQDVRHWLEAEAQTTAPSRAARETIWR